MLHAQVYTTSSATYRSISNCGMLSQPNISAFRSTSAYTGRGSAVQESPSISYSTAPMRMANGTITTVASQLKGGVLTEGTDSPTGYIPTRPQRVPGVPLPVGEGWDVVLLLAMLCGGYVVRRYISVKRLNGRKTEVKASEMR
jgi:hypothetical protein